VRVCVCSITVGTIESQHVMRCEIFSGEIVSVCMKMILRKGFY